MSGPDSAVSADELLQHVTELPFLLIAVVVTLEAVRRPHRANIDIALFFGSIAAVIAAGLVLAWMDAEPTSAYTAVVAGVIMALPYLMLRLVDDFDDVPTWISRAAEAGLIASLAAVAVWRDELPGGVTLLLVLYFAALTLYAAAKFVSAGRRGTGVTRRRMEAAALGTGLLGVAILWAGAQVAVPGWEGVWTGLSRVTALGCGVAYYLGFAPPRFVRRAWQEPELRSFLSRAAVIPRLPDTAAAVAALEEGASVSTGAGRASIALWDEANEHLVAVTLVEDANAFSPRPGQTIVGKVFESQRAVFVPDAPKADPEYAELYRTYEARTVLAAPITAGDRRLGVLAVYTPHTPIFGADDLELVELLAQQSAVVLESRALMAAAAAVEARAEATRLKDDFLSAAAHDLRTPLTTLLGQAQLMERRARRNPEAPADVDALRTIVNEAQRLRALVVDLLDASRVEQGRLLGEREPVDLAELAREVAERRTSPRHRLEVEATGPVTGVYDRPRVTQLIENLVENAEKYSPAGGEVRVRVWRENGSAHLEVSDRGIGIPPEDVPHIFERFQRANNVDDRRFAGMGLGLYICKGVAEEHGGTIGVRSRQGEGSTFEVVLPAGEPAGT